MNKHWGILGVVLCGALAILASCGGGGGVGGGGAGGGSTQYDYTHGLAACPAGNAQFSVPPLDLDRVQYWEPLGHQSPPAHVFPTDHQYVVLAQTDPATFSGPPTLPLMAPADVRIYAISASTVAGITDYSVYFMPCGDLQARFGHVTSLSAEVLAAAGSLNVACTTYQPAPGSTVTSCNSNDFKLDVKAGAAIGTAKGVDFWLRDRRVVPLHFANPGHFPVGDTVFDMFHTVGASDYFTTSVSSRIAPKIGGPDPRTYIGSTYRTKTPLSGTIGVDVDGTAMGHWFNAAQAYPPESYHASLVRDSLLPDNLQVFSIGVSQPNTGAILGTFTPTTSGDINRSFDGVTADGNTYCYQVSWHQGSVFLLKMVNATTLRLEFRDGPTGCVQHTPYTFTANAFDYVR